MERPEEFEGFVKTYMTDWLTCMESCDCMGRPHPELPAFHREWIELTKFGRLAVAAPRSFAKSVYFSVFYPLFCALEGWAQDILLISSGASLAEEWLMKIKRELESNEELYGAFNSQISDLWRQDIIQLKNGTTIRAKGSGCQIRGLRPDLVIVDDLESEEDVWSETCRNKTTEWFWKTLVNVLNPDAQLIIIGTLLHPESLLCKVVREPPPGWTTRLYKAMQEDKSSIWPSKWSQKDLEIRRAEIGASAFEQEYQNNPIPEEWRTFHEKDFKYFVKEPDRCAYFTTVDPAITVEIKHDPDYTAIVTCAVDSEKNIYFVDYTRKRMLPAEIISEIFEHNERYNPECIAIEQVGFQKVLKFYFDEECKLKGVYPYIKELKVGGMRKNYRIERLQPYFEKGKVFMKEHMTELKSELLSFPTGKHDDLIDAAAGICEIMQSGATEKLRLATNTFGFYWDQIKKGRSTHQILGARYKEKINPWSRLFAN